MQYTRNVRNTLLIQQNQLFINSLILYLVKQTAQHVWRCIVHSMRTTIVQIEVYSLAHRLRVVLLHNSIFQPGFLSNCKTKTRFSPDQLNSFQCQFRFYLHLNYSSGIVLKWVIFYRLRKQFHFSYVQCV